MAAHDHDHDHGHHHHHHAPHEHAGHDHAGHAHAVTSGAGLAAQERRQRRRLAIVLVVISLFFVVELLGAKAAQSDVLEADAYHLLMDVFALGVSLVAMRIASAHPNDRFTFGLRRAEPLAALLNGLLVLGVAAELVHDGVEHLQEPTTPKAGIMLIVASAALVVNGLSAWVLHGAMHGHAHGGHDHGGHGHAHHGHAHLNLRGAWLHLLGDALGSVSAFVAGLAIRFGASSIVDPIASFLVVGILVIGAVRLLRDAGAALLDAAPKHLPVARVREALLAVEGVRGVNRLHVWSLGTGHDAVTAHLTVEGGDAAVATRAREHLREAFHIEYVTLQVERP